TGLVEHYIVVFLLFLEPDPFAVDGNNIPADVDGMAGLGRASVYGDPSLLDEFLGAPAGEDSLIGQHLLDACFSFHVHSPDSFYLLTASLPQQRADKFQYSLAFPGEGRHIAVRHQSRLPYHLVTAQQTDLPQH